MVKNLFLNLIFLPLLLLYACGHTREEAYHVMLGEMYANTVPTLHAAALSQKLEKEDILLFDTRTQWEYTVSHLKSARFINYDSFNLAELNGIPKQATIVLYCSVGYRSEKIGEKLKAAGYTNVYNLYGGLFEWVNKGYKVYNHDGPTQQVHAYSPEWSMWLTKGEKVYD